MNKSNQLVLMMMIIFNNKNFVRNNTGDDIIDLFFEKEKELSIDNILVFFVLFLFCSQ